MSFGFPSYVAISLRKKAYALFRNSYSQSNLETFTRNLVSG